MTKKFFNTLTALKPRASKIVRAGRIDVRVDCRPNGDFVVSDPNSIPARFRLAYDAAQYLGEIARKDAALKRHQDKSSLVFDIRRGGFVV